MDVGSCGVRLQHTEESLNFIEDRAKSHAIELFGRDKSFAFKGSYIHSPVLSLLKRNVKTEHSSQGN